MNEYDVFWINEEFSYHYFYKSGILYRFLNSYQNNKDRMDLSTQFRYITYTFPEEILHAHLRKPDPFREILQTKHNQFTLYQNEQSVVLYIYEHYLKFQCETLHDAEDLLFPILREFHPYLFIMNVNKQDYGWLSPSTKRNELKTKQLLYSYR